MKGARGESGLYSDGASLGSGSLLGSDKFSFGKDNLLALDQKQRQEARDAAQQTQPDDIGIILQVNIGGTYEVQAGGKTVSGVSNLTQQQWIIGQWVTIQWTAGAPSITGWAAQQMGDAIA